MTYYYARELEKKALCSRKERLKEMSFFLLVFCNSIPKEPMSGSLKQRVSFSHFPSSTKGNSLFFSWWHENETWLSQLKAKRVLTKKTLTLHLFPSFLFHVLLVFTLTFHNIYWKFNDTCVKKRLSNFFNIESKVYTISLFSLWEKSIHFTAQLFLVSNQQKSYSEGKEVVRIKKVLVNKSCVYVSEQGRKVPPRQSGKYH